MENIKIFAKVDLGKKKFWKKITGIIDSNERETPLQGKGMVPLPIVQLSIYCRIRCFFTE